ncbi:MAG TPA: hypothetical protein VHD14_16265 [Pseudolabrys sp.]|nr:hypothetical protein [Pseudolabrys sp.]
MPRSSGKTQSEKPSAGELTLGIAAPAVRRVLVASLIGAIMLMIVIAAFTVR